MCSFFGPLTDSMKHNLSPWGTGSFGTFNLRGGPHSALGVDLGLEFGVSRFALRSGALRLGFEVLGS